MENYEFVSWDYYPQYMEDKNPNPQPVTGMLGLF
jgi:hypothetical protein